MQCSVCGHPSLDNFLELPSVPVFCNVLWPDRKSATGAARGDIALAMCPRCAMVANVAYDPALVAYSPAYENSLHFSPSFQRYAKELARRLVDTYAIRNSEVVEIGSGKGDFLAMLCEAGGNHGVGYDPSYAGEADDHAAASRIRFYPTLYGDQHAADAALVCSRHVLEHVDDPRALVQQLGRSLAGRDTVVYCEVPDAEYMLREGAIYDVIYEHQSHFSAPPMRRLFGDAGLVIREHGTAFGGQYLYVEAVPGAPRATVDDGAEVEALIKLAAGFATTFHAETAAWSERLLSWHDSGQNVVVWGAGSKGVTFLNVVPGADTIHCIVDVNPRKAGRHVPGTGQAVVGPDALRADPPQVVIVMNPLYEGEVRAALAERHLKADVVVA